MTERSFSALLIVFADLTRFMVNSRGTPDGTLAELLDGYYRHAEGGVSSAGGRVVKFMGDAFLAVWSEDRAGIGVVALPALKRDIDAWWAAKGWDSHVVIKAHFGRGIPVPRDRRTKGVQEAHAAGDLHSSGRSAALTLPADWTGFCVTPQGWQVWLRRFLVSPGVPAILSEQGEPLGWLTRLLGSGASAPSPSFDSLQPGDEIWSGGQPWQVTAVLTYKDAGGAWPVVRIQQALTTAWTSIEDDRPVRYDHLDLHVGGDGRALWNGRTYTRQEVGTASIEQVVGEVDARPGDTLSYQVLRSPDDPEAWISVETWAGGYVEVSVGRPWPVDRLVAKRERST